MLNYATILLQMLQGAKGLQGKRSDGRSNLLRSRHSYKNVVLPVERKGVEEDDGRVVGVDLPVGDGLELLHQLHHLVVVLDLSAVQIKVLTSAAQRAWEVKLSPFLGRPTNQLTDRSTNR